MTTDSAPPWSLPSAADPSGVHARESPQDGKEWRARFLAEEGAVSPMVESLIASHERLRRRVEDAERLASGARVLIDRLHLAVFLLDGVEVFYENRFRCAPGGTTATSSADSDGFRAPSCRPDSVKIAIHAARRGKNVRRPFVVEREADVDLIGLALSAGRMLPGGVVIVVADPVCPPKADAEVFAQHFRLTPTEGRVAELLARGATAKEIASEHSIGVETVRTHIKNIRKKMGVDRQIDLVRRLLGGPLIFG